MHKYLLFIILLILSGCSSNEKSLDEQKDILIQGIGIIQTDNEKYPLLIQHENGERFITVDNDENGNLDGVLYSNGEHYFLSQLDESTLLPTITTTSDGEMILYSFRNENSIMDIGFVDKNGAVQYFTDIEISLPTRTSEKRALSKEPDPLKSLKIALFAIKTGINVPLCVGGAFVPGAQLISFYACLSAVTDTLNFLDEHVGFENETVNSIINQFTNVTSVVTELEGAIGCLSPIVNPVRALDCVNSLLSFVSVSIDILKHNQNSNVETIESVNSQLSLLGLDSFVDSRDGQRYRVVKIGSQIWMAENLNYDAGDSFCYDYNSDNCKTYGRLYKWATAEKACPNGWRIPNAHDWRALFLKVGGDGNKIKSAFGWDVNTGNTNTTGFSALPAGVYNRGSFIKIGDRTAFWSISRSENPDVTIPLTLGHILFYSDSDIFLQGPAYTPNNYPFINDAFSCRCIKE